MEYSKQSVKWLLKQSTFKEAKCAFLKQEELRYGRDERGELRWRWWDVNLVPDNWDKHKTVH